MTAEDRMPELMRVLGYTFANLDLLREALTHRSYVNEVSSQRVRDNERLEFLGDAVLELTVSTLLMELHPSAKEGALSKLRAQVVNETNLAEVARKVRLGDALRLGRGEELTGGRDRSSILADAFEAVLAAVYLDGGFEAAKALLERHLEVPGEGEGPIGDPKTDLQEQLQARVHRTPTYGVVREDGPDHDKTFVVATLVGTLVLAEGEGRTKKDAERAAARAALARLSSATPEFLAHLAEEG
jgi:ribonuclease-3